MVKFKVRFTTDGVDKTIDAVVNSLSDIEVALKRLGKYIRFKANRKFKQQGPGWPALKQQTLQHRAAASMHSLEIKLRKDVRRAKEKAVKQSTIETRINVLEEFKRLERGDNTRPTLLNEKQSASLQKRIGRAKEKALNKKLLGRIASSLKATVKKGTLTVESEIPWAGIHNDGGTAGHSAKIPQREFLAVDEDDLEVFEGFLLDAIDEKLG